MCGFLQSYSPTAVTDDAMSRGQKTNSSARRRVCGMRIRAWSGFSLFTATARGSCVHIRRNPSPPIPMYITIFQGLTGLTITALRLWYWPLWRNRIMSSTWAKGKWQIFWACRTQMKEQLDCHLLCSGVALLLHQPFVIPHGIGGSSHLIQIRKGLTSNLLDWIMSHQGPVAFRMHLRGCRYG